jgi:hypothetical protein
MVDEEKDVLVVVPVILDLFFGSFCLFFENGVPDCFLIFFFGGRRIDKRGPFGGGVRFFGVREEFCVVIVVQTEDTDAEPTAAEQKEKEEGDDEVLVIEKKFVRFHGTRFLIRR